MNFLKIINYSFFALIVVVGLFLLATILPIPGNYEVRTVMSGSMEPVIRTGGVIITKSAPEYHVDDIITFYKSGRDSTPTTHRIVAIQRESAIVFYTTKGDANDVVDGGKVTENEVVGKVVATIPLLGYAVYAAQTKLGFMLFVILPIVLVILSEVFAVVTKRKEKQDVVVVEEKI